MTSQAPNPKFENVAQRVVFSYRRQMPRFEPVLFESLSPSEQDKMRVSQRELDAFFRAFYQSVSDDPERYGLSIAGDVCLEPGASKERKQAVTKTIKKARDKLVLGVEYLYHVGCQGTHVDGQLRVEQEIYEAFFAKGPRVKQKLVQGMQAVGLTVSEQDATTVVANAHYPNMMLALETLARACAQRDDQRLGTWLFACCDLRALDAGYRPGALDLLHTALVPGEYARAVEIHHALAEKGYEPLVGVGGADNWRIQYQGPRAIKGTPILELQYDERKRYPLQTWVKCASTNRLVPLLAQQPLFLQKDFFQHAHSCGAPKCSWCKTRKGLNPSVLEFEGEKRTICWWMQRHFVELDGRAVDLVRQYVLLHEALLAA